MKATDYEVQKIKRVLGDEAASVLHDPGLRMGPIDEEQLAALNDKQVHHVLLGCQAAYASCIDDMQKIAGRCLQLAAETARRGQLAKWAEGKEEAQEPKGEPEPQATTEMKRLRKEWLPRKEQTPTPTPAEVIVQPAFTATERKPRKPYTRKIIEPTESERVILDRVVGFQLENAGWCWRDVSAALNTEGLSLRDGHAWSSKGLPNWALKRGWKDPRA